MTRWSSSTTLCAALALASLVGAGAALIWLRPGGEAEPAGPELAAQWREATEVEVGADEAPVATRQGLEPAPRVESDDLDEAAADGLQEGRAPRKEREFRAAFVKRQLAEPGWLEREAEAVLASDRTNAEKVALLRALEDTGSKELGRWLEHALRTCPDVSSAQGVSLPTYALTRLQRLAPRDLEVRGCLMRIAFESPTLSVALRRSAAATVAALCGSEELPQLERILRTERDPDVLSSAIATLGARSGEGPVANLLARNGWEPVQPQQPASEAIIE